MRNLFSERFLEWIEWAIIIQLVVVALFVICVYGARLYLYLYHRRQQKRRENLRRQLQRAAENSAGISQPLLRLCAKDLDVTVSVIDELDNAYDSQRWKDCKIQIAKQGLAPKARRYSSSRNWFKRYLATQCFHLHFEKEDEPVLIRLIADSVMLVALDAAEVVITNPSQNAVDKMIDCFSETRRIRQDSFAQMLSRFQPHIDHFFIHRLQTEKNPYIRAFCFRMLTYLPVDSSIFEAAFKDADDENIELCIAALTYLSHVKAEGLGKILLQKLDSEHWQLRGKAVSLLAQLNEKGAAEAIAECLKDSQWWVRINAAEALGQMGSEGIALLKRQDASTDKFAYEAAQFVLRTSQL